MAIIPPDDAAQEPALRRRRTAERCAFILEQLEDRDFISVKEVADKFDVTETSVRRDLSTMVADGLITRVRGGAARPPLGMISQHYAEASTQNAGAKLRVARRAAALLDDVSSVSFYSGSTVARVVSSVDPGRRAHLTVVTNSLPVIEDVSRWTDSQLVVIGGLYLPAYMAFVGPQAVTAVEGVNTDVAVVGCDGLSADGGLTTPHHLVAEVGSTMIRQAGHTIVVADATKIGRRGFTQIAPISAVNVLVTEASADPREVERLRSSGVQVVLV